MSQAQDEKTAKTRQRHAGGADSSKGNDTLKIEPLDVLADLEATLDEVAEANPRIGADQPTAGRSTDDLKALLEVSMAINSSLVADDVLQIVMRKAIELMEAERGLIMLLDDQNELQVRSAYNLCREQMMDEDFKVSNSITSEVARTGKSIYTSDALTDERYANQRSVVELHLRSIMCVPLKVKEKVIGVIYLDNSNESRMFLKSDLYLFELYAQLVSNALHNANIYNRLLNLQQYNESVVASNPVGTVVVDSEGRMVTVNAAALEIFDFNREKITLVGEGDEPTKFVDLLLDTEVPRWTHMINTALSTKEDFSDSRYFHNTGYLEKALSAKISPIWQMPHGKDGVIMAVEDITEKVIMEKYVILSEKLVAKGEMAASIAHELNNYLAIASNNAELMTLNIDRQKFDKVKFNSKAITENVFKIKRFVDSLMDFSKPESEFISYDIKHLIEDLLFSLRVQPRFKRTHFTIDLDPRLPNLEMDVGQIQQVLMNLLNNAADAIEDRAVKEGAGADFKREITIKAWFEPENERVIIAVRDNGIGMNSETLNKIFTLHFTTKKGGHGLGLSNCRKIVESHHGDLLVDSAPDEGTEFQMILPRFQPEKKKSEEK